MLRSNPPALAIGRSIPSLGASAWLPWAGALTIMLLSLIMLFWDYDARPMEMWDESRSANNAIEMLTNGNWLVLHYNGDPDHWNTKPPLFIWLVALLMRVHVPALLALRLPSMLAALGTLLLIFTYCHKYLRDGLAGFLASLILLASWRFIGYHAGRSGDFDALLVLFTTGYSLSFFSYVDAEGRNRALWMVSVGLGLSCAVLTKGTAGGLAVPGLLAYAALRGKFRSVIFDQRAWKTGAAFAVAVGSYYLIREAIDPGYLKAVFWEEMAGRYFKVADRNSGQAVSILEFLLFTYAPWSFALPLPILMLRRPIGAAPRLMVTFCLVFMASFLLLLLLSKTVLAWYPAPILPFLAIAIGLSIANIMRSQTKYILPKYGLLAILFVFALRNTFYEEHIRLKGELRTAAYSQLWYGSIVDWVRRVAPTRALVLIDSGYPNQSNFSNYNAVADFYAKEAARDGIAVKVLPSDAVLEAGSWVGTCDPLVRRRFGDDHDLRVAFSNDWCVVGRIVR